MDLSERRVIGFPFAVVRFNLSHPRVVHGAVGDCLEDRERIV